MMKFILLILPQFLDDVESSAVTGKPLLAYGLWIDSLSAHRLSLNRCPVCRLLGDTTGLRARIRDNGTWVLTAIALSVSPGRTT